MKFTYLRERADGSCWFEPGELAMSLKDYAPPAPPLMVAEGIACHTAFHVTFAPGWTGARHPAPARQIAYCLSGRVLVEASAGQTLVMNPGDILWMEDVAGEGHVATNTGEGEAHFLMVRLAE